MRTFLLPSSLLLLLLLLSVLIIPLNGLEPKSLTADFTGNQSGIRRGFEGWVSGFRVWGFGGLGFERFRVLEV